MFSLISFRFIGAAVVAALLAAGVGWHFHAVSAAEAKGYKRGADKVTEQWDKERQRIVAAALAASQQARQKEAAYVNAVEATRDHYARESAITAAAVARAGRELERLRIAVNTAAAARSGSDRPGSAAAPADARELSAAVNAARADEGAGAAGVLLLTCGGRLREMAQIADELSDQVRGLHRHTDALLEHIAGKPPGMP